MLKRALFTTLAITVFGFALLILALPSPKSAKTETAADGFIIENASVFDGTDFQENASILVRDGLIEAIGDAIEIPAGMLRLDMSGKTIIPGLIDAHTHTYGAALSTSLRFGVTTNLDMFMAASMFPPEKERRDSLDPTNQADLFSATTLATVEGGHGTQYGFSIDTLNGPDSAPDWVAKRVEEGADYIKLVYIPRQDRIPSLDLETATAVIDAAHQNGLKALAHISTQQAAEEMVDSGIDGLVHLFADVDVTDAFIAKAKANDVFIIPTLAVIASVNARGDGAKLSEDPMISPYLRSGQAASLSQSFGSADIPGYHLDRAMTNIRKLHEGGVTILAGTDAPNPGTLHGASLHQEIAYYVDAGLPPEDALRTATSAPAKALGLPHSRGRIETGGRADFVVLNGNPLSDIRATRDIHAIFKNGAEVTRKMDADDSPAEPLPAQLASFERDLDAPDGWRWMHTDDRFAGGKSEASVEHIAEDGGALLVKAEVKTGFPYPWGGAFLTMASQESEPNSIKEFTNLSFRVRGTPGAYSVMMFTPDTGGIPPSQTFNVTEEWQTVSLPIDGFNGLDPSRLMGMAIVAGPKPGDFQYQIDDVSLVKE